jgi:triacylglycerol lipase
MTDPSPTSWQHRALVGALRLARVNRRAAGTKVAEIDPVVTPMPDHPKPPRWLTRHLLVEHTVHAGWPVWVLQPRAEPSDRVVVGIHGGGYITDILFPHWYQYCSLAGRSNATVVVPLYPLAPWGTAGTVVPAMTDLVAETVTSHGADRVGVLADSAGAGLALATMQNLVRRNQSTPARLVLISPWLDVTISDPASRRIDDPLLNADGLTAAGKLWADDLAATDPWVSPLFGSLAGLPRTAVYGGSLDLLYPDAVRLQRRTLEEGVDMSFTLRDGLIHGWAGMSFLPEASAVGPTLRRQLLL